MKGERFKGRMVEGSTVDQWTSKGFRKGVPASRIHLVICETAQREGPAAYSRKLYAKERQTTNYQEFLFRHRSLTTNENVLTHVDYLLTPRKP